MEKFFLNGKKIRRRLYWRRKTFGDIIIEEIPEGNICYGGDNRGNSLDSRSDRIGLVDTEDISGKVIFQLYPFSKFGKVK